MENEDHNGGEKSTSQANNGGSDIDHAYYTLSWSSLTASHGLYMVGLAGVNSNCFKWVMPILLYLCSTGCIHVLPSDMKIII